MIHCIYSRHAASTGEVVVRALRRSFTCGQVQDCADAWPAPQPGHIIVAICPTEDKAEYLRQLQSLGAKILLLGPIGPAAASVAGIVLRMIEGCGTAVDCGSAQPNTCSESSARIRYRATGLGAASPLRERRLCRFDFLAEWNNLGYGRIGLGDDPFSIACTAHSQGATAVAELTDGDQQDFGAVATVLDLPTASILWFARPVGPVDGPDWRVIEAFIADHRHTELPCRPFLRDVPHGVGAAVTMRLDCDEDIASARPLYDLYRARGLPLSLAVKTDQPEAPEHFELLAALTASGGSILSHSATHAPNWGGSAEAAEHEARVSKAWLEAHVTGLRVRYAVSPFHQNPSFVPAALARAGYDGFVGGIIANDPEYLMARGGEVPYGPPRFISHSQACMLHGDCVRFDGDPIRIYKEAFRIARAGGQFFGYLDHPFSARYAYGWTSEQDRLMTHAAFLDFAAAACAEDGTTLLFVNEETCLDFMLGKSMTEIQYHVDSDGYTVSRTHAAGLPLSIGFRGRIRPADNG